MAKFDLFKTLTEKGFTETADNYGRIILTKSYEKEVEVVWYGKQTSRLYVDVYFNSDKTVAQVAYMHRFAEATPFKTKTHLNDKRAYNAIAQTIENNGFEI